MPLLKSNSNSALYQSTSGLINSQLPEFIVSNNPNFAAFLKAYYQWMEQANSGAVLYHTKNLLNYKDIDKTTDEFIQYFINDFLPYFPPEIALDERKMVKVAREFYSTKGSEDSIKFLFRVLYNKDAEIFFPKEHILKASDGKWQIPQAIKVYFTESLANFDVNLLVKRQAVGDTSFATCTIEGANVTVDPSLGIQIVEIFVSNIVGAFLPEENLVVNGTYPDGAPFTFKEGIISFISNITIDPNHTGSRYVGRTYYANGSMSYTGDPVVFIGGLSNSANARVANAYVNNVTSGSISSVSILKGGFGFRQTPNSYIKVVGSGSGANLLIQDVVYQANPLKINTDSIEPKANLTIASADYEFANSHLYFTNANSLTSIGTALSYSIIPVGSISRIGVISTGSGYYTTPDLDIESIFETDQSSFQYIKDYGYVANVQIINPGTGYNPLADQIILNTSLGYGASFNFTVNATGSIETVTILNSGEGYKFPLSITTPAIIVNKANNQLPSLGTGAKIIVYGYNEGENVGIGVSGVGRIIDFWIADRGFDYVSTPQVSVRVADITTDSTEYELTHSPLADGVYIYQGASLQSNTFSSKLDYSGSLHTSNLIQNGKIRVYNYSGYIDQSKPLKSNNGFTTNVTNVTYYGDGAARANAEFLKSITEYPGYYLNTDGQPSADQYLQDSAKYHNYSYVVQVEKSLYEYKDILMKILHPAGMKMLADMVIYDEQGLSETIQGSYAVIPPNHLGTVTANKFDPAGTLYGSNVGIGTDETNFLEIAEANDLVVLDYTNPSRVQTKLIKQVISNTVLVMESNTMFLGNGTLSTNTANGNVLTLSTNNAGNVIVGDTIAFDLAVAGEIIFSNNSNLIPVDFVNNLGGLLIFNEASSIIYANVVEASVNTNTITIDATPNLNANGLFYFVFPLMANVPYQIIREYDQLTYERNEELTFINYNNDILYFANSASINIGNPIIYDFYSQF